MEIERKFLVEQPPEEPGRGEPIEQGYLALDGDVEVRLRRRAGSHRLTVKQGHGSVRVEEELELTSEQFSSLWPLTDGRRLTKVRHTRDGIELDVYQGALSGLCVAEVEFEDEAKARAFLPPPWFGRELTGDTSYANRTLACDGLPR